MQNGLHGSSWQFPTILTFWKKKSFIQTNLGFFPLIMAHSNFRLYFDGINELFLDHLFLLNATGSEAFPGDQLGGLHD